MILPQGWKDGNVTPIFKKGKKHQPGNYRPTRVMEKLARKEIMEHLINNNLLSKFQHGFIKARSCTTQLLAVLDDWTDVIEHGENVDAIYLDYAKAFDTVPPQATIGQTFWIRHRWETTEMDRSLLGETSTTSQWQQIIMDPSHEPYTPRQRLGTAAVCLLRKRHARKHNIHGLHVRRRHQSVPQHHDTHRQRSPTVRHESP